MTRRRRLRCCATVAFGDLPRSVQVQLAALGPLLFGLVTGFLLEASEAGYWAAVGLSVVGGLAGGTEHRVASAAALRGLLAGTCFGIGVVVANAISDEPALATLPKPPVLLIVISGLAGCGLAAAGARLAPRG